MKHSFRWKRRDGNYRKIVDNISTCVSQKSFAGSYRESGCLSQQHLFLKFKEICFDKSRVSLVLFQ